MVNRQLNLGADFQPGTHKAVERVIHHAFGRILDGHDAVVHGARFHLAKHLIDAAQGASAGELPKLLDSSRLCVGARGSQVGNGERDLERKAARNHLAEQALHCLISERTPR